MDLVDVYDPRRAKLDRSPYVVVISAAKGCRSKLVLAIVMVADIESIRVWLAPEHVALFYFPEFNHHVLSPSNISFKESLSALKQKAKSVCLLV